MNSPLRFTIPDPRRARAFDADVPRPSSFRLAWLLSGALALAPLPAGAQTDPKSPHVETVPPRSPNQNATPHADLMIAGQVVIGRPAPAFELDGSRGEPIQLSSLRGDWTVLQFMPRMDAAPALAKTQGALAAERMQLVCICHEKARAVESFARHHQLPWLLLADVTGEVGAMYGVWDSEQRAFIPGTVIMDVHGIVRYASIGSVLSPDQIR
ncbi:MAG: peroxiredoxin family protein, partial [Gaiellaceae bacterium]